MDCYPPVKRHVHHGSYRHRCPPTCLCAREVHITAPDQLAPLKLTHPGGWSRSGEAKHQFPWNSAELWLALEHPRRSTSSENRPNKGKHFMFDCTATGCHPNLKVGSTIVALLCGDSTTTWLGSGAWRILKCLCFLDFLDRHCQETLGTCHAQQECETHVVLSTTC